MLSLSEENQSDVIEAFNSTSRYLDDLLNIDNNFCDSMINRIYPSELQLNKANVSDAEASFLCPATKNGRVLCYTLRTFECLSVHLSVRPSVRLSVRPSLRQRLIIPVRCITLIPFKIISRNLAQM